MQKKESQKVELLSQIAISGDFPADSLGSLGNLPYKQKIVTALKQDRMITVFNKDGLKSYRLTAKAKRYLLSASNERFSFYLTGNAETNLYRGDVTRRLRLHRIAQTVLLMQKAGVSVFRDEKIPLFTLAAESVYPVRAGENCSLYAAAFYDSHEIKAIGLETVKIKNSRSVGILITANVAYIVYNTMDTLLKWESRSETKNLAVMSYFLRQAMGSYAPKAFKAIMIGRDMEIALQILRSTGGYKRRYLMLDETFENLLFIPNTEDGTLVLTILCSETMNRETENILRYGLSAAPSYVDCDGIDDAGAPVLFAYDCDLQRIVRFNAGISNRNAHGVILCFDFQEAVLRQYCNAAHITIRTISSEKYKRRFLSEQSG